MMTSRLQVTLPLEVAQAVNEARGTVPVGMWLRQLIERELERKGPQAKPAAGAAKARSKADEFFDDTVRYEFEPGYKS